MALLAGQVGSTYTPTAVSRPVESATLYPESGTQLVFGRGEYEGQLDITPYPSGLAVVEETTIDKYLLGIAEVPSSWPDETLAAQAVAARSYLAWTLERGRSTNGTRYDYDICASQQCQVYRGPGEAAESWAAAVRRTSDQILIYNGRPAQALYSSSAGSRTRSNQDIWGGSAVPYLQAVDSPEQGYTPYSRWELSMTVHQFARVLAAGGYDLGAHIEDVVLRSPGEGNGPEYIDVTSDLGVTSIPVADFRATFNIRGPDLYPSLMPATRADGRQWPQTILSYTLTVSYQRPVRVPVPLFGGGAIELPGAVTVVGEGWGHAVGMSQWGAMALGSSGATYQSILDLYYGLTPEDGGDLLPDTVRVGLLVEEPRVVVAADGPFRLEAPGFEPVMLPTGEYVFWWTGESLVIVARSRLVGVDSPLFPRLPRQLW